MLSLDVPGAKLHFEVRGEGPLLLLIAGARGTDEVFEKTAKYLAANYTVILYDRRGHSQSFLTGEQDYSRRLERDADDAAELIEHLLPVNKYNTTAAYAFGTSAGAIVASALLRRHPDIIEKLICHEPPLFQALAEDDGRDEAIAATRKTYEIYRSKGAVAALQSFGQNNVGEDEHEEHHKYTDPSVNPYAWGNLLYWLERELPNYPLSDVPWEEFERDEVKRRLVLGVSEQGSHLPAARVAKTLGKKLGLNKRIYQFPGAHLGYLTHEESFAEAMKNAFEGE